MSISSDIPISLPHSHSPPSTTPVLNFAPWKWRSMILDQVLPLLSHQYTPVIVALTKAQMSIHQPHMSGNIPASTVSIRPTLMATYVTPRMLRTLSVWGGRGIYRISPTFPCINYMYIYTTQWHTYTCIHCAKYIYMYLGSFIHPIPYWKELLRIHAHLYFTCVLIMYISGRMGKS